MPPRERAGPLPAIAPRNERSPSGSPAPSGGQNLPASRRSRFPPRSRNGCWTCRNRKVKCTEERPACAQCVRLGHQCDYSPRVAFRDDTPRVMERLNQEISTVGSSVWDPGASESNPIQDRSLEDLLPPFAALTTDEDRERKAELQNPGTYNVIANPGSFTSLPEYRDEVARSTSSTYGPEGNSPSFTDSIDDTEDPNVVILRSFDEAPRRGFAFSSNSSSDSASPAPFLTVRTSSDPSTPSLDTALYGGRDQRLLQHYRVAISPRIIHTRSEGDEDVFEAQARVYPPLFHAMMALAALDISNRDGIRSSQALEHYQSVIPALKAAVQSSRDSYSDGALFTHFILLLYEIAAVGHGENMWQQHCDHLKRIITLRRQASDTEVYDFIVWAVYSIDIYALLSVSGTGAFADSLLAQNRVPPPEKCLPPLSPRHSPAIYTEEQSFFPGVLELNQQVMLLAYEVGRLAQDLRQKHKRQSTPDSAFHAHRQSQIQHLHRRTSHLWDTWQSQFPDYRTWLSESRPPRVFSWISHSYALFRACVIYAHTSMYPNQLLDPLPDTEATIKTCVAEIIQIANLVISQERVDQQYIVFPLFMAGIATKDSREKEHCLGLIRAVEQLSYGRTVESVREFLETIYEKQQDAVEVYGNSSSVDWVEDMELSGQQLIIYAL